MGYKSVQKYEIQYVLDLINAKQASVLLHGQNIRVNGDRLKNFAVNGTDCICCGAVGKYFSLESNGNNGLHFNLYALTKNGSIVLMTRDHIVLKSKGGPNTVSNYNPMCSKCNRARGNKYDTPEEFIKDYYSGNLRKYHPDDPHKDSREAKNKERMDIYEWRKASCFHHVPLYYKNKTNTELNETV